MWKKNYSKVFYEPEFFTESPQELLRERQNIDELSTEQLKEAIINARRSGGEVNTFMITFYKNMAYPMIGAIMVLIGFSLGSRFVRGASALSIGMSAVIGYMYYVVMKTLSALSVGGIIEPIIGGWAPNIIFIIIGMYLVNRAEY
jgi:lipopolysaccharide export system permease protein